MAAQGQNIDGVRLVQQGAYPAAMQRFQQALASDPQNADAIYNLAAVYHRTAKQNNDANMLVQAEQLYNQSLNFNPNHVEAHRGLAVLLAESNRRDQAMTLLRNWTVQSPGYAEAKIEFARLQEELGDLNGAAQQLTVALQQDLNNARALAALARIKERSGDMATAIATYEQALRLDRNQPQLAQKVADLRRQYPQLAPTGPGYFQGPTWGGVPASTIATGPRNPARY